MLISLPEIVSKYNLNIKGVIQVGAHWAEEHDIYVQLGINNIVYIEPCGEAFGVLIKKVLKDGGSYTKCPKHTAIDILHFESNDRKIKCIYCACGEEEGEFEMYVSNNNQGQSNSLLQPKLHINQHPEVVFNESEKVKVAKLDNLWFSKSDYNLLVMDVQGFEGHVLKGATETLKHIDCIYTEVNRGQTYAGNMEIDEMDEYLKLFGFVRVETYWPSETWSWGDACFLRESLLS
jgi:FkbM family methyltransferase